MSDDYTLRITDPVSEAVFARFLERLRTHGETTIVQTLTSTYLMGDAFRIIYEGKDMGLYEIKEVHGQTVEVERVNE